MNLEIIVTLVMAGTGDYLKYDINIVNAAVGLAMKKFADPKNT